MFMACSADPCAIVWEPSDICDDERSTWSAVAFICSTMRRSAATVLFMEAASSPSSLRELGMTCTVRSLSATRFAMPSISPTGTAMARVMRRQRTMTRPIVRRPSSMMMIEVAIST